MSDELDWNFSDKDDAKAEIRAAVRSITVTDSGSEIVARNDKPGVSNLLDILSAITGSDVPTLEAGYVGKGYGALKTDVAEAVIEGLAPIQARYAELIDDRAELARLLQRGAERARAMAAPVLAEVRDRVGLVS